jgi:uroporphyrinogen-III synthase
MRVVITRPVGDAQAWVEAFQAAGHDALALPLIDVAPAMHQPPVAHAWAQWTEWQAVMFVSAQAVRYFFECQPEALRADAGNAASHTWAHGPRCWATGPGTHKALLQAGVPEACIDSPSADAMQFDSEALWQRVSGQVQVGKPVLIVRGHDVEALREDPAVHAGSQNTPSQGTGRDWLAQQLNAAGASARFVVAYERRAPVWTTAQRDQAIQAAGDGSVWCFSSSQAIAHLAQALPQQSWHQARCLATHPRIAKTAQNLGFGEVHTARPSLGDVLRSLESLA